MYQHFIDIGLKYLGIHLQEFLGLLFDSSCVQKPKGAVDAFADDSHCAVEGLALKSRNFKSTFCLQITGNISFKV